MTIRSYLSRRARVLLIIESILLLIAMAPAFIDFLFLENRPLFYILFTFPFLASVLMQIRGFSCCNCNQKLGEITLNLTGWRVLGKRVNFCPFCGVSFEKELGSQTDN